MMFGPKRDEVTGEWRRIRTEELYALYSSANIIQAIKSRRIGWMGHVARMGDREVHTGFWWGRRDGKRSLGRYRRRWEDNIKMNLQEVGWGGMDFIDLAHDSDRWRALVKVIMKHRVP